MRLNGQYIQSSVILILGILFLILIMISLILGGV